MKLSIFSLLVIFAISLASCRKDKVQPTIKQYDNTQILNYIAANGLSGFQRDTTGGDTSGIYYKIMNPGTQTIGGKPAPQIQYSTQLAMVFTVRTLDGSYIQSDTINNHIYDFVGHITNDKLPAGLQLAVHNVLKYPDASMRVLIPSHLAYGVDGYGSGSSTIANNRIAGNECLDYYIHAVNNFPAYDDMVIVNYMKANSLSGYSKTADGLWYKILIPATTNDPITENSTITATYTGQIFNGVIFDGANNGTNIFTGAVDSFIPGVTEGLENYAVAGTEISMLIPSSLGYGLSSQSGIPAFSCLRFTWQILTVTP
jgi:FKBP-type peptidyl-prolyl cis-trans isomerase FkpA